MRRSILLLFSFGVIVAGASAGDLHTDIFGNVCDGDWSIPVGQVEPGSEGRLRVDVFGNIYVEDRRTDRFLSVIRTIRRGKAGSTWIRSAEFERATACLRSRTPTRR